MFVIDYTISASKRVRSSRLWSWRIDQQAKRCWEHDIFFWNRVGLHDLSFFCNFLKIYLFT